MKLVNFDFLRRVGLPGQFGLDGQFRIVTVRDMKRRELERRIEMSKRKRKKRVNKVFVSRGGIRL